MNQQIDREFQELFGNEEKKIAAAQPLKFKRTKNLNPNLTSNPNSNPTSCKHRPQFSTNFYFLEIPENLPNSQPEQPIKQMQQMHANQQYQQQLQQQVFHMAMKKNKQPINPENQELISKKPFNVKNIRQGSAKNDRLLELEKLKQQQGNLYEKLGLVQEKPQQFNQEKSSDQQNTPNAIAYAKPDFKLSKEAIQAAKQKNESKKQMTYEQGKITEKERLELIRRKKLQSQQIQQEQWLQQKQEQSKRKQKVAEIQIEDDNDQSNELQLEDDNEEELIRPSTAAQKFQFKPKQDGEKKQFLPVKEDANKNLENQNIQRRREKELAHQRAKMPVVKGLNRNELREMNQDIPVPRFDQKDEDEEEILLMAPVQKKKKGMMLGGQKVDEREIVFSDQQEIAANQLDNEEVSEKVRQQRKRCRELRNMVFLEEEQLGDILVINPTGQYEQYVNRIKKSVVKNIGAQCNDDNVDREVQTDDIETNDFVNQCPEDRIVTFAYNQLQEQQQQSNKIVETPQLTDFVFRISPIVEELLDSVWVGQQRQVRNQRETEPQLLWLQVSHPSIEQNQRIRLIYSMDEDHHNTVYTVLGSSTVIELQNGRVSRGFRSKRENDPITAIHRAKYLLFAGFESGGIEIFDLRAITAGQFYSDPVWDNCIVSTFSELSSAQDTSRVVAMKSQISNNCIQLIVLQQFSRIELWNVVESDSKEMKRVWEDTGFWSKIRLFLISAIPVNHNLPDSSLSTDFQIDPMEQLIFVLSKESVQKVDRTGTTQPKAPRVYQSDECSFPTAIHCMAQNANEFLFVGYSDGSIAFFNKQFATPVSIVSEFTSNQIAAIANSFIELKVKGSKKIVKFEDFSKLFVVDADANLFVFDFIKDSNVPFFFQKFIQFQRNPLNASHFRNTQLKIKLVKYKLRQQILFFLILFSEIDQLYSMKINFITKNLKPASISINLTKYIEKDFRVASKNCKEFQNKYM